MAQSFIATATASASVGSSSSPPSSVDCSLSKTSAGRRSRCTAGEKTLAPNGLFSGWVRSIGLTQASPLGLPAAGGHVAGEYESSLGQSLTWRRARAAGAIGYRSTPIGPLPYEEPEQINASGPEMPLYGGTRIADCPVCRG